MTMALRTSAPQAHNQPSRKGKKAWRKNIDIASVTNGLVDLRDEIIATGGPLAEKSSNELFTVDTTGDDAVWKRITRAHKPLKVDEILAQRSAVPALDTRKRKFGVDGMLLEVKKRKSNWVNKKEVQRLKQVAADGAHNVLAKVDGNEAPTTDLWGFTEPKNDDTDVADSSFVPAVRPKVPPPTIHHPPVALTASGRPISSVPKPNPGTSYNPSFTSWDDLLTVQGEKELQAERKRLQEEAAEAERAARIEAAGKWAAQPEDEGAESAWEGIGGSDAEMENVKDAKSKKRPDRKTPAQRNRIKRRKEAEQKARHESKMKLRDSDQRKQSHEILQLAKTTSKKSSPNQLQLPPPTQARRTTTINTEIATTIPPPSKTDDNEAPSSPSLSAAVEEEESEEDEILLTRRAHSLLGGTAPSSFPLLSARQPLELVLPDELQDSLRRLRPEGNLLRDRFRNLLVNGKIEARKRVSQPKRARRSYTEKWRFKDFKVVV